MRLWIPSVLAALALPATGAAGTVFLLDGRGWGHGVGMSQWGAEGYARNPVAPGEFDVWLNEQDWGAS